MALYIGIPIEKNWDCKSYTQKYSNMDQGFGPMSSDLFAALLFFLRGWRAAACSWLKDAEPPS